MRSVLDLIDEGWAVEAAARHVGHAGSAVEQVRTSASRSSTEWGSASAVPSGERESAPLEDLGGARVLTRSSDTPSGASPTDAVAVGDVDAQAVAVAYRTACRLLGLRDPTEATDVLIDLVHGLGGEVVPAAYGDQDALPLDLSFGTGEPILPSAPRMSLARMRLEFLLPELVESARNVVELLRSRDPQLR